MPTKNLLDCSYDELIDIILNLQYDIDTLEQTIDGLKEERTNKINKDFEDNKKMMKDILESFTPLI